MMLDHLLHDLVSEDKSKRDAAVVALAHHPEAIAPLAAMLHNYTPIDPLLDEDDLAWGLYVRVCHEAARALSAIGPQAAPAVVDALLASLDRPQAHTVRLLGGYGHWIAAPALISHYRLTRTRNNILYPRKTYSDEVIASLRRIKGSGMARRFLLLHDVWSFILWLVGTTLAFLLILLLLPVLLIAAITGLIEQRFSKRTRALRQKTADAHRKRLERGRVTRQQKPKK